MSSEWGEVRLGDACLKIGSGATPKGGKDAYLEIGPFRLIRSQNIVKGAFSMEGIAYIDEKQADKLSNVEVRVGDVLLNITGDSVARAAAAPQSVLPARVNQHVAIVRPDPSILDSEFLHYWLNSPVQQEFMLGMASIGATRNALTKSMIEDFRLNCPDVGSQKAIARTLGSLDDRIDNLRATNATLEAIAQAIFKSWFIDFDPVRAKMEGREPEGMDAETAALFPSEFEESELGLIPRGWRVQPIGAVFEMNPRRSLPKGTVAPYLDMANTPTKGHVPDQIISREFSSGSKYINGDTLLARITPCLENGKAAFVDFLADNEVGWGSTEFIVLRPRSQLPPFFGYLLARQAAFKAHAISSMSGTSGRQRVQPDSLATWGLPVPDGKVSEIFGAFVEPLRKAIALANEESRALSNIRDLLLPRLISGKLRIEDAPEAVEAI